MGGAGNTLPTDNDFPDDRSIGKRNAENVADLPDTTALGGTVSTNANKQQSLRVSMTEPVGDTV